MLQNGFFTEDVVATKYYPIQWDSECVYMYDSICVYFGENVITVYIE